LSQHVEAECNDLQALAAGIERVRGDSIARSLLNFAAAMAFFVELGVELEQYEISDGDVDPCLAPVPAVNVTKMVAPAPRRNTMAKYLLLKHYRGAPAPVNDVPMDRWTPAEISAHVQYMRDFAARLEGTGEFVDSQALAPEGTFVRYDGEGRPPVTDGPFAETKDLIAGWMVVDVDSYERAVELAADLSAAPGAGGEPIHEWLEVRPFLAAPPTVTE
jgi:hypothetical protein